MWLLILLAVVFVMGSVLVYYEIDGYETDMRNAASNPVYKVGWTLRAVSILFSWLALYFWRRASKKLEEKNSWSLPRVIDDGRYPIY